MHRICGAFLKFFYCQISAVTQGASGQYNDSGNLGIRKEECGMFLPLYKHSEPCLALKQLLEVQLLKLPPERFLLCLSQLSASISQKTAMSSNCYKCGGSNTVRMSLPSAAAGPWGLYKHSLLSGWLADCQSVYRLF